MDAIDPTILSVAGSIIGALSIAITYLFRANQMLHRELRDYAKETTTLLLQVQSKTHESLERVEKLLDVARVRGQSR